MNGNEAYEAGLSGMRFVSHPRRVAQQALACAGAKWPHCRARNPTGMRRNTGLACQALALGLIHGYPDINMFVIILVW